MKNNKDKKRKLKNKINKKKFQLNYNSMILIWQKWYKLLVLRNIIKKIIKLLKMTKKEENIYNNMFKMLKMKIFKKNNGNKSGICLQKNKEKI